MLISNIRGQNREGGKKMEERCFRFHFVSAVGKQRAPFPIAWPLVNLERGMATYYHSQFLDEKERSRQYCPGRGRYGLQCVTQSLLSHFILPQISNHHS